MKKILIPLTLLLIGGYVVSKINLVKNIHFKILDIQFIAGFPSSRISVVIRLINPTKSSVVIRNLSGVIAANGTQLGTVNMFDTYNITANGFVDITVDAMVSSLSTLQAVIETIKKRGATINFKGTLTADNFLLPIDYNYQL